MQSPEIRRNFKRNAFANIMDGGFFGFGIIGLASYVTIIPLYLSFLTESTALIGFVATMFHIGWQLPQLLTGQFVAGLHRFKPTVLVMTLTERLPYFGLAVVALLIPSIGHEAALLLTLLLLSVQSLGGGFTATAWQSMISKVMPPHRLGTFFGLQSAAVNLFGAGGALLASVILERLAYPESYALLFFITGISLLVSFAFLALTVEPVSEPHDIVRGLNWRGYGQRLRQILRDDGNFRWFIIARCFTTLSLTVVSFYTIFGIRRFDMSPEVAGLLTSVLLVATMLSSAAIGWVGDRWGHRPLLIAANLLTVAAILLTLSAPDVSWFVLVFALTGFVNATQFSSIMTLTVQFSTVAERPLYIGMSNTLIAPVTVFAPIIAGWLIDASSFDLTFVLFAAAGIVSTLVFVIPMSDPRSAKLVTAD